LDLLQEAEAIYRQSEEHKLEGEALIASRYQVAFLNNDVTAMRDLAASAMGKPGTEDLLLALQADTEAWNGRLKSAWQFTQRAIESAEHNQSKEAAAAYQIEGALREAEFGYSEKARADAGAALKLATNRDVGAMAALAMARAGDTVRAEKLASDLSKAFPVDTLVQSYWLPSIRAAIELQHKSPDKAVAALRNTLPYDLGVPTQTTTAVLYPAYLRGEAYLMLRNGNAAVVEFRKLVDHRGIVANFPLGALARIGLARAYALQGDTARARAGYLDFFTQRKDSDASVPILNQAKAEYAKVQ
jgi:hypothetical protein